MRKLLATVLALGLLLLLIAPNAVAAKTEKVNLCHKTGNQTYQLISVSAKAVPAHLAHGDAYPGTVAGDKYIADDCTVHTTVLVQSAPLYYGSTGWGGWSCPAGTLVAEAWVEGITVAQSALWVPGASIAGVNYPNTPFGYTYTPPEEGFIAQADNAGGTATIYLVCYSE